MHDALHRGRIEERLELENGTAHLALSLDHPASAPKSATPILYLHGFGSSKAGDKAMFFRRHFLRQGRPFCALDFRGHGDSGGDLFDLSLSRNLDDIGRAHGFLRSLGYRKMILFGSSMGGVSALWYAAFHPAAIEAAIHIAPALAMEQSLLRRVGEKEAQRWQREGRLFFPHERAPCELSWALIEDLRTFDKGRLSRLYRTPTLIFQGGQDDTVSPDEVIDFARGCAEAAITLHLMGDGDHRLADRLEHLWRVTTSFLEALALDRDSLGGSLPAEERIAGEAID